VPAGLVGLAVHPACGLLLLVPVVQRCGQAVGLDEDQGWQVAADLEGGGSAEAGHPELADPSQGAQERCVASAVQAEADGGGRVGQVQVEPVWAGVHSVSQSAEQPAGAGSEDPQPVGLDVGRAGVVAEPVDDRVDPGSDVEAVCREGG